jgi:hypothetical protein
MATIVSGTFLTFDAASRASAQLRTLRTGPGGVAEFYRSPDGHHLPRGEVSATHGEHEAWVGGAEAGERHNHTPRRRGGPVVAIESDGREAQETAGDILAAAGAVQVEITQGRIVEGEWQDYDPESVPNLVIDRT